MASQTIGQPASGRSLSHGGELQYACALSAGNGEGQSPDGGGSVAAMRRAPFDTYRVALPSPLILWRSGSRGRRFGFCVHARNQEEGTISGSADAAF